VRMVRNSGFAVSQAGTLALTAHSGSVDDDAAAPEGAETTLLVAGGGTPAELREYPIATFAQENPGSSLVIEEQVWGGLVTNLTAALPDAENTPDVVEIRNTRSPTLATIGAFRDLTPLYEELGGDDLLQSFVEVGAVEGKDSALPYCSGSRYMFYRADIWSAAGLEEPITFAEFGATITPMLNG